MFSIERMNDLKTNVEIKEKYMGNTGELLLGVRFHLDPKNPRPGEVKASPYGPLADQVKQLTTNSSDIHWFSQGLTPYGKVNIFAGALDGANYFIINDKEYYVGYDRIAVYKAGCVTIAARNILSTRDIGNSGIIMPNDFRDSTSRFIYRTGKYAGLRLNLDGVNKKEELSNNFELHFGVRSYGDIECVGGHVPRFNESDIITPKEFIINGISLPPQSYRANADENVMKVFEPYIGKHNNFNVSCKFEMKQRDNLKEDKLWVQPNRGIEKESRYKISYVTLNKTIASKPLKHRTIWVPSLYDLKHALGPLSIGSEFTPMYRYEAYKVKGDEIENIINKFKHA